MAVRIQRDGKTSKRGETELLLIPPYASIEMGVGLRSDCPMSFLPSAGQIQSTVQHLEEERESSETETERDTDTLCAHPGT